ncbi:hypothetical protein DPMN_058643 [Dreissena polymorpha]|uniref:Uncharacterized protein n=1 Tax=Dreissena polymorpha TaxID=45954 RepID=A0A9D4C2H0_DREPO|nr:hypothetical protein DPMN_058643 [Dreissena polymorpha]
MVNADIFGIENNPETVMLHQDSVVVPESMEISDERRNQLNHILQKDTNTLWC